MLVHLVGSTAVLLEVDEPDLDGRDQDELAGGNLDDLAVVSGWQEALAAMVGDGRLRPPAEVVAGARTLLLDGVDVGSVLPRLDELRGSSAPSPHPPGPVVELPVVYDGADLDALARMWGITQREVVARHTSTEFRVAFCGFAPGFPYLVGFGRDVPRRATPRACVPAGSVGLAGRYCGIYPTSSPGGWQLLGTTGAPLFEAERDPPALLPPGTRVRFLDVTPGRNGPDPDPSTRTHPAPSRPGQGGDRGSPVHLQDPAGRALTVVRPGALTTVQDAGRPGLAHLGVPRSGALDAGAASLANRLVGNPEGTAVLETTVTGVALRAASSLTVAVTGALAAVWVDARPVPWGVSVGLAAGQVVDVGPAQVGVRSYLAVAGGVTVHAVLGSRSTDTLSGLGPPPLREGTILVVGARSHSVPAADFTLPPPVADPVLLRITCGPRDDWFGAPGIAGLLAGPYVLSSTSNRIGARLTGPPVPRLVDGELESEGMVLGAVQVPPNGQPVVLLADHPTTGGYPVIGVVHPHDLVVLAQTRPGAAVRFVIPSRRQ